MVENYEKEISYYHRRHFVKLSIRGLLNVNYPYGVNSEDSKQKLMYIKKWSLWLRQFGKLLWLFWERKEFDAREE